MSAAETKSPGQLAYERDIAEFPTHQDGKPRPSWDELPEWAKPVWEREARQESAT